MHNPPILTTDYQQNRKTLDTMLRLDQNFDLIGRNIIIGSKKAVLYFVDGFAKDEVMEKIMEFLMGLSSEEVAKVFTAEEFSNKFVTYVEADIANDCEKIVTGILSGTIGLLVESFSEVIMIDARTYPTRGMSEPEDSRVLRGSRDGFVETLVHNTALIRRRIRDPNLTMDITQIGSRSKTDVVLCYLSGKTDSQILSTVKERINNITIPALTMSQESLAECLAKPQWYNPFPRVRYSERPDAATASILEGNIVILVDNSPSAMILPTSLFDFTQDTNDFYFPPLVGTYLRFIRTIVFWLTLLLTPVWYLLIQNPQYIPSWLSFIQVEEPNQVPIIFQLLIIEFVVDGLKLASLNTPSVLSSAFSVVGALILGEFAIKAQWFVPEVVLYMAFVSIANFTQPSFELGYALKFFRIITLILTAIFNLWGFISGIVLMIVIAATTKTITGRNYLYPIIPFNGRAFLNLMLRRRINRFNS